MNEITRWVWDEKTRGSWHEVVSSLIFHSWLFSAISVGSNGISPPSHTPSHFQQGRSIYVALFFLFLSTQQSPSSDTFQRKWNTCPCVLSHCHPGTQTASRRSPSTYSNLGFIQFIRMTPLLLWRHVYTRWHFAQHLHSTTAISNISLHDILTLLPLSTLVLYPFHCYRSRIQIGQHFVAHIGGLQPNSRILTFPSSGNLHTCTFCPPSLSLGNESDVLR